jgi:hypothetical protein
MTCRHLYGDHENYQTNIMVYGCISKMKCARVTSVPRMLSLVALVSPVLSLVLLEKFSRASRRI